MGKGSRRSPRRLGLAKARSTSIVARTRQESQVRTPNTQSRVSTIITISIISILPVNVISPSQDLILSPSKKLGMADLHTASQGSWTCLLEEALPSIATSTQVFANAPAKTTMIRFTLRTKGATARFDGSAATAGGNGIDLAQDATYELPLTKQAALLVRMIQSAATTTGWIQYYGHNV